MEGVTVSLKEKEEEKESCSPCSKEGGRKKKHEARDEEEEMEKREKKDGRKRIQCLHEGRSHSRLEGGRGPSKLNYYIFNKYFQQPFRLIANTAIILEKFQRIGKGIENDF